MLLLGVEVRLGVAVLCLGIVETSRNGSRVHLDGALRLGAGVSCINRKWTSFGHSHRKSFKQNKTNSKSTTKMT